MKWVFRETALVVDKQVVNESLRLLSETNDTERRNTIWDTCCPLSLAAKLATGKKYAVNNASVALYPNVANIGSAPLPDDVRMFVHGFDARMDTYLEKRTEETRDYVLALAETPLTFTVPLPYWAGTEEPVLPA